MKFSYDPRYNVAYICFHEKKQEVETIPISDEVVIDMAPDGTIYGIELLDANRQLRHAEVSSLLVINEATGEQIDLPLALGVA